MSEKSNKPKNKKNYKPLKVKDNTDSYATKIDMLFDLPFRLLINGRSGSGKSNMLVNLLLNDNYPYKNLFDGDNIYLFSPEIQGDRKAEKYKTAFELARKMLNKNGLTIGDPESEIVEDIKRLNKIRDDSIETPEQKKIQKDLEDYQESQKKVREKNKSTKEKIEW